MFSIFLIKKVIPHVRLSGIIGNVGRFKQGIDLANQRDILKKAFSVKKNITCSYFNKFSWRLTGSITSNL